MRRSVSLIPDCVIRRTSHAGTPHCTGLFRLTIDTASNNAAGMRDLTVIEEPLSDM